MAVRNHLRMAFAVVVLALGFPVVVAPVVGAHEAHEAEQAHVEDSQAYVIVNPATGLVLDVRHDVEVFLANVGDSGTQQWVLTNYGQGRVAVRNVGSDRCLEVPNGSLDAKKSLQVGDCNKSAAQAWDITAITESLANLTSARSGHAVAIPHWAKGAGSRVIQDDVSESPAQQWGFFPVAQRPPHAALGSDASASVSDDLQDYIVRTFYDVRDYWDETTGEKTSVGFVLFGSETYENSCLGPVYEVAYCSTDDSIFMRDASAAEWARDHGRFTLAMVIAHEYGHNMQEEIGGVERGPNRELQADCYAGAWAADANRTGWTKKGDFVEALNFFSSIGGENHGTGDQRRDSVLLGWMKGPNTCRYAFR